MRQIKSFINDAAIQAAVDDKSLGKPYVALDENTGKIDWNGKDIGYSKKYLTIEALETGGLKVKYNCLYSKNEDEWISVNANATISLTVGDKIKIKGSLGDTVGMFSGNTISFAVYGNILSLNHGDDFKNKTDCYSYSGMFYKCANLNDASNLILPATVLKNSCYDSMFRETNITKAPELLAELLTAGCYSNMFYKCTRLNYVKCLATNVENSQQTSTTNWLSLTSPTGTFIKAELATRWGRSGGGIPSGWTVIEE